MKKISELAIYDAVVGREDLMDIIKDINPVATPFAVPLYQSSASGSFVLGKTKNWTTILREPDKKGKKQQSKTLWETLEILT